MRTVFIVFFMLNISGLTAQIKVERAVEETILKAGTNKTELEKAFRYYNKTKDSLKYKAMLFLLSNIDIHYSATYYWADSMNKKIDFDELSYESFEKSIQAFDSLKTKKGKLHPVAVIMPDITTIKSEYLIDNVERAFKAWQSPWAKNLDFDSFCEYILPYRASIEPVQDWRKNYEERFAWIKDSAADKTIEDAAQYLGNDIKTWFENTFNTDTRKEPLPRLGARQLLHRRKGPCEDIADLAVFALRSQGIPITNDMVTYWATSSGSHFFNSTIASKGEHTRFDVSTGTVRLQTFAREPAKVIRTTYAKQLNVLANLIPRNNIPQGFMQSLNYKDVTAEYWPVKDVHSKLFSAKQNQPIVYACVFNYLQWRPTWWGNAIKDSVVFSNMCKGAVFLPVYYENGKIIPAGYPVASGYEHEAILAPDTAHRRSITLNEQDKYLKYKPEHVYKLFYWDNKWKLIGQQIAKSDTHTMVFDKVPENALLLMYPDNTQFKERPFMITKEGQRVWW